MTVALRGVGDGAFVSEYLESFADVMLWFREESGRCWHVAEGGGVAQGLARRSRERCFGGSVRRWKARMGDARFNKEAIDIREV